MPDMPLGNTTSCSLEHMWELPKYDILGMEVTVEFSFPLCLFGVTAQMIEP